MTETKKNPNSTAHLVIVLVLICAITALCLGLVDFITRDRIEEIKAEKTASAMNEVLAADAYTPVEYTGGNALIKAVYEAGSAGYVVEVAPSGFGGAIDMVVGLTAEGEVTGVSIVDMSETSGLGANASKADFRDQFVGKSGSLAVSKDGGEIQALTGATVTSRAVTNGVTAAIEAVLSLG